MVCTTRSVGCDGPYTSTPCAGCVRLEGRCQHYQRGRPAPVDGCDGPFTRKLETCAACKKMEAPQSGYADPVERRKVEAWKAGLNLGDVALRQVFEKDSLYTPARIDQKYALVQETARCPWVKIGNLYASVTRTGVESWDKLVDTLCQGEGGVKKFVIFTGRHGEPDGTIVTNPVAGAPLDNLQGLRSFGNGVREARHRDDDVSHTRNKINKMLAEDRQKVVQTGVISIEIWDVGCTPGSTMSKTKRLACECLDDPGTVVIFAWCFSLMSFFEVDERDVTPRPPSELVPYNLPIKTIVAKKFGWVEVKRLAHAGNPLLRFARPGGRELQYAQWRRRAYVAS